MTESVKFGPIGSTFGPIRFKFGVPKNCYHTPISIPHRSVTTNVNPIMEYEEVKAALADKSLMLIDVRNPDELEKHGKIPGSINIPC